MMQDLAKHLQFRLSIATCLTQPGAVSIALTVAVGVAYFLAAQLSLALLTKADGVAVFWPAAGVSSGVLIALGPSARWPVAVGAMAATIVANFMGDRSFWGSVAMAVCNAAEALITAGLIQYYFGPKFTLERLKHALGLLAAAIIGTAISGVGGTIVYKFLHSPDAPILITWQHWFASDVVGIVTVAPLIIGLASALRDPPPRSEIVEGVAALLALVMMTGIIISLPPEPWETVVPVALLFPMLLWLAARCRPFFASAGAFLVSLTIVWTITFGVGHFGDPTLPIDDRILEAQAGILVVALCSFVLAALFAERREHESVLRESETRFRELAENMSQFAWTADQDGRRYWYNKRWHDYAGTAPGEMLDWGWQKLHHPDHLDRVLRGMKVSFADGTPWEDTFPLRGRDGSYRWFLTRARPIRDEKGNIIRWFGTNTDITQQIEAEKALHELNETLMQRVEAETRERLRIWNVSQDLLSVGDLEGKYISVNPAWTALLGWSESELLGRTSQWLLHPDDQEKTRVEIGRLAAGQKTLRFESRFRHQNGSYRWISWKAAPEQGRIYAMGRDITELKQAENQLREARQELAQVARRTTLAAMSAAIAHEIKQPLAAIVANANAGLRWMARTQPRLDEAREALEDIAADGHRASEIIQSIRVMFSKGDQTKTTLDVNVLIRETIAIVRGEFEASGIAVHLELASPPPMISAHRGQLQQVILNILTNAADAMRNVTDRTRLLRIVSQPSEPNDVALAIEDSGTGIDSESLDRIFEAFFTTKANGMGMGLAICRLIVEAHGGTLSASPNAPYGSIFRVKLPGNL